MVGVPSIDSCEKIFHQLYCRNQKQLLEASLQPNERQRGRERESNFDEPQIEPVGEKHFSV